MQQIVLQLIGVPHDDKITEELEECPDWVLFHQ